MISVENYINIGKAIDLNNSADDATLTQQMVDGQEDENVQSERIVTSSEALVGIDSVLVYIAQKNLGVEVSV